MWKYAPAGERVNPRRDLTGVFDLERESQSRAVSKARRSCVARSPEERIHLMKLSEALCDYIHVRQVRFRTLVEEGEDRSGECSA
jgi:hypothetical protein